MMRTGEEYAAIENAFFERLMKIKKTDLAHLLAVERTSKVMEADATDQYQPELGAIRARTDAAQKFTLVLFERSLEHLNNAYSELNVMANRLTEAPRKMARSGAIAMLAIDPKQKDKAIVRRCWDAWQKNPDDYERKADFARDMREQFPKLKSQPVIERWCREWERETKTSLS